MKKDIINNESIEKVSKEIVESIGNIEQYKIKNKDSISCIFLAGAPGSGKTEFLNTIFKDLVKNFVVIDIDNYRNKFTGYNGKNASKYQKSSVKVADKILKYCFKNNLNFVFDGTFRNYNKVKQNLSQIEKYERKALINLVFQEPTISFYYTFLRELQKKRNVPIEVFVEGFYNSIFNIFEAKKNFKNIDIIIANKKYKVFNKNKYTYKIDYNPKNLKDFCKYHNIKLEKGKFRNRENLKLDLQNFKNILEKTFHPHYYNNFFSKIKIWLMEKIHKL